MNDYDDLDIGGRFLPGVDLTLWVRLVVALIAAIAVGAIALAAF